MILNVQCGFNPIQSASFHYVWRFEPINLLNPRHFYWSSYWSTPVKIAVMYICIRVLGVSILPLFNYDVVLYWSCSDSLVLPLFNCDVVLYWSLVCFVLYWSCSDNLVCFVFHFISTCYLYFPIFFLFDGVEHHFQPYISYIVAVSFIGGGNRRTRRKPPTCLYFPISVNVKIAFVCLNRISIANNVNSL
jgi:hypothetical protein